jgi:hypothetical protein
MTNAKLYFDNFALYLTLGLADSVAEEVTFKARVVGVSISVCNSDDVEVETSENTGELNSVSVGSKPGVEA